MRISELSKVTGVPLATLKDLRHRSILELASAGWEGDDDDEAKKWGSFSVPAAIIIRAAAELRETYSLPWAEGITFAQKSLDAVSANDEKYPLPLRFYDLSVLPYDIWAGRFDFENGPPDVHADCEYFYGQLSEIGAKAVALKERHHKAQERRLELDPFMDPVEWQDPRSCILINATKLCKTVNALVAEHCKPKA